MCNKTRKILKTIIKKFLVICAIFSAYSCGTKNGELVELYKNGKEKQREFYNNGILIYSKLKDENGTVISSKIPYTITILNKNPKVNDTVRFKLKVNYSQFNHLTVMVGELDQHGKMKPDPKYSKHSDSLSINLFDTPNHKGKNIFFGRIMETTKSGDNLFFGKEGSQSFTYEYEVN